MTNVVITGANRGIGLELCRVYQAAGADVYGICRKSSAELQQLNVNVIEGVDVTQPQGVHRLQEALVGVSIDLLINNAGILSSETLDNMDFDAIRQQFEVNTLGPLRVVNALQGQLKPGAKVAMITSRMGSIEDNTSGGYYGYRMSKTALNSASMSLARDLEPRQVAVGIFHPGFVQTDMVGHAGDISPQTAAERLSQRIEELSLATTGSFRHSNGDTLPW